MAKPSAVWSLNCLQLETFRGRPKKGELLAAMAENAVLQVQRRRRYIAPVMPGNALAVGSLPNGIRAGDRATEFKQGCDGLGIKGVLLHSYRYAWAERALKCGYPERFAQQALGQNSKTLHHAYFKHADVTVPSLDDWEKQWKKNPQGIVKPAVVQMDLQAMQGGEVADNAVVPAVAGGHGA